MEYVWNSKTNCFDGYNKKYKQIVNEKTGEKTIVEIPCDKQLYSQAEIDSFLLQCSNYNVLKDDNGKPAIVALYTEEELLQMQRKARLSELEDLLARTNTLALSFANGEISAAEYESTKQNRIAWLNELKVIKSL